MTTALMCIPKWWRMVCARCLQPPGADHDCITRVRHREVERYLECLKLGEFALAEWHYQYIPDREKPVIAAILEHAA